MILRQSLFNRVPNNCFSWFSVAAFSLALSACGAGSGDGLDKNGQPLTGVIAGPSDDLFTQVQEVFTANCIRCHSGPSAPQGMSLAAGVSYNQIVNVASNQKPDLLRINPSNPDDSYLLQKVLGSPGISGSQMPLGGPFLSSENIQIIRDWIAAGAPQAQAPDPEAEVIIDISALANYRNWQTVDYSIGVSSGFLTDGIHSSGSDEFVRRVYANDIALNSSGDEFANGSILVKETFSYANDGKSIEFAEAGGLLAMVKRGGTYSPDGGGWEWFNVKPDLSGFNARGIDVRQGTCLSCHSAAELDDAGEAIGGHDYVFAHSSEVIADDTSFANYRDWHLIDTLTSRPELLGDKAHGAGVDASRRLVYKKQLYANPDSTAQGYPIGTAIVKEAYDSDGNIIDVTAMLKRGGGFSPMFGDWEWFLLEAQSGKILVDEAGAPRRGAMLNNGGCVGCHAGAKAQDNTGIDFVFKHAGDPFNNHQEFVAELSDFQGFENWALVDYTIGAANAAIAGGAHQGANDTFSRRVYANPTALNFDGTSYAQGSIIVKAVTTRASGSDQFAPQDGLLAMVKRGGSFNQENGGWEYFGLETDLSGIIKRGADVNNGGCNACHQAANGSSANSGSDYIFPTPTVFVANNDSFQNYTSWLLVDERSDRNPQLGAMAHGAAVDASVRKVYKKQDYAYPIDNAPGYPVATTYVKEIFAADGTTLTGLVAMVKMTETSELDSGALQSGWEFFVLDPASGNILLNDDGSERRGTMLSGNGSMTGGCVGCHAAANSAGGTSKDYIFDHPDDPFVGSVGSN
ncbi:cytochrome P460 family protein [Agaribacterium haliotis]|uniref:cytochrome P460 family protein n=1 Tax=Agaribacterium haliotis TaxID=2013869 RepID=UPI000BB53C8A|nr:cytochrome P460 family protein [Agaribacterium haliotis]